MGLKEAFVARQTPVVTHEVPGIGPVRIRRLTFGQMCDIPKENSSAQLVAICVLGDAEEGQQDRPFFSDIDAVKAADSGFISALLKACDAVNTVDVPKGLSDAGNG